MGHLLISKIYGYCIYALAVFTKKIKPKPNTLVFDLGLDWRKEWDSLRDNYYFYLFFRILIPYSFFFILSLSRRGCKQPFHRLFGRLVISKKRVSFTSRLPTRSNPTIDEKKFGYTLSVSEFFGGKSGIRTHDTLPYT